LGYFRCSYHNNDIVSFITHNHLSPWAEQAEKQRRKQTNASLAFTSLMLLSLLYKNISSSKNFTMNVLETAVIPATLYLIIFGTGRLLVLTSNRRRDKWVADGNDPYFVCLVPVWLIELNKGELSQYKNKNVTLMGKSYLGKHELTWTSQAKNIPSMTWRWSEITGYSFTKMPTPKIFPITGFAYIHFTSNGREVDMRILNPQSIDKQIRQYLR